MAQVGPCGQLVPFFKKTLFLNAIWFQPTPIATLHMLITSFATPALLFPAISLLMLSYTNKFLAIANLIRNLH
jgi:hypothetical protein